MSKSSNSPDDPPTSLEPERWAILALLPVSATVGFYLLPDSLQRHTFVQFLPQLAGYLGLGLWAWKNTNITLRLGIQPVGIRSGIIWGSFTGLLLGAINAGIILWIVPALGHDILFLNDTPHAQIPITVMIPWFVIAIAIAVELNFRGFLLGRLSTILTQPQQWASTRLGTTRHTSTTLAICLSAFTFAFDPFMVETFQHLHWIAIWDGLIWGSIWIRYRNLYTVITAHAVEVIILYTCIKVSLS